MVTKVEINGYEITIEEMEGVISVKAEKDEEIIEEFTIETEEGEEGEGEDVKGFGEFGDEEEDFGGEESQDDLEDELQDESQDDDDDDDDENERPALESFQSFINKK
jgi:hypothetical protein